MKPRTNKPLPFDASLDPSLAALHAACDGKNDIRALVTAVAAVEPGTDETTVWSMLDDLSTMGCLEQAAAPPVDRGFTRRSLFRGLAVGAAAAATVAVARPARGQALEEGELLGEELLGIDEEGQICSLRTLKAGGQREAQTKRVRSAASEQHEKATLRYEEASTKAEASGDRRLAEEARKKFQAERDTIREEAAKGREYQPKAARKEQELKRRQRELSMDRAWKAEPGVGRAPAFLSSGEERLIEGEIDALRTTFVESEGSCGGLRVVFHFRSRQGEGEVPAEDLASRGFPEILRELRSWLLKGEGTDGNGEVSLAWGIEEGLAYTGLPSGVSFHYTAWDESGEPSEGFVKLLLT